MKTFKNYSKIIVTASAFGILMFTSGCAEKATRPEAGHEHVHTMGHGHMESLERAVEQAKTPADHLAVAARYEQEADKLLKLARHHENMADIYTRADYPKLGGTSARHCRKIAGHLREVANEMKSLAEMHRQMAGQ